MMKKLDRLMALLRIIRERLSRAILAVCCLFVAAVSVHDAMLVVFNAAIIGDVERNPLGRWFIEIQGGEVWLEEGVITDVVVHNLRGHDAARLHIERCRPKYVAVSPGSGDLAIACLDGSINIWSGLDDSEVNLSTTDGQLRTFRQTPDDFTSLTFSPDGHLLAAAGSRFIYVWRWPSGELLHKRPYNNITYPYLSFSGDCQYILSPGTRYTVCLWNVYTGKTVAEISPDRGSVIYAALSPDAKYAALCVDGCEVRVYTIGNGQEMWRIKRATPRGSSPITYSPDGRVLAIASSEYGATSIVLCNAISGQVMSEFPGHAPLIAGIAYGPENLLYSHDIHVIRSWNVEQYSEQWSFSTAKMHEFL